MPYLALAELVRKAKARGAPTVAGSEVRKRLVRGPLQLKRLFRPGSSIDNKYK